MLSRVTHMQGGETWGLTCCVLWHVAWVLHCRFASHNIEGHHLSHLMHALLLVCMCVMRGEVEITLPTPDTRPTLT